MSNVPGAWLAGWISHSLSLSPSCPDARVNLKIFPVKSGRGSGGGGAAGFSRAQETRGENLLSQVSARRATGHTQLPLNFRFHFPAGGGWISGWLD